MLCLHTVTPLFLGEAASLLAFEPNDNEQHVLFWLIDIGLATSKPSMLKTSELPVNQILLVNPNGRFLQENSNLSKMCGTITVQIFITVVLINILTCE